MLFSHIERLPAAKRGAAVRSTTRWTRRLFTLASDALFVACAFAQNATAASAFDQGLLWRLERADVAAPSYLFGTIHVDDKRVTILPEPVRRSFEASRTFTMEVSLESPEILTLATRMLYTDGRTLEAATGRELYRKLVPEMESRGVPEPVLRNFRPWAAMMVLAMPQQNSLDVLDFVLYKRARESGKQVFELESVGDQVGAFEGMPEANQTLMLKHTVETLASMPQQTERLLQAYLARDLARMWQISEETTRDRADLKATNELFEQKLLTERNTRMLTRMQPQLRLGGAFVAVGALHLYGERGLLQLLQRQGWRLTRVY